MNVARTTFLLIVVSLCGCNEQRPRATRLTTERPSPVNVVLMPSPITRPESEICSVEESLDEVLSRCQTIAWNGGASDLAHLMLLWGRSSRVQRTAPGADPTLEQLALNDAAYRATVRSKLPLITRSRYGLRFLERDILARSDSLLHREAHVGQLLSVLAECGVGLETAIQGQSFQGSLANVLDDAVLTFSAHEELDWVMLALIQYLPPETSWTNKYNHTFSFDSIAEKLLQRPHGKGTCGGTHTLYTLAAILNVQLHHHVIVSPAIEERIVGYLREAADRLCQTQGTRGQWNVAWATDGERPVGSNWTHDVWITGHQLDWMSIVSPELRVGEARILSALQFVLASVLDATQAHIRSDPCTYLHGVRAACRFLARSHPVSSLKLDEAWAQPEKSQPQPRKPEA